jgi:hypothetical protein
MKAECSSRAILAVLIFYPANFIKVLSWRALDAALLGVHALEIGIGTRGAIFAVGALRQAFLLSVRPLCTPLAVVCQRYPSFVRPESSHARDAVSRFGSAEGKGIGSFRAHLALQKFGQTCFVGICSTAAFLAIGRLAETRGIGPEACWTFLAICSSGGASLVPIGTRAAQLAVTKCDQPRLVRVGASFAGIALFNPNATPFIPKCSSGALGTIFGLLEPGSV